ncbi:bifunctional diaminohydroxyphosphoribosylaminopyrimidine deaminase/5-amino-6-(5-phosphoribosylamino)uracil reductase RibD [Protaetiibacter mangrovi]|uniref:Riboflavin biosynthesis protein RibD n=1 Tax=Protaetiibacter mangrovi TaxID=2970926 RepID=A0ABT1ZFQ9_9MICO|nr:bifunctional diaminohydroxyphosphoribosylaminopyrimidine deaminase/5-amino-6-(5-phosphoribosylamino)uracil reductase RibD [Protaetiibacter mangrovi]MCS0499533.1 bifunctional diaminohydroxyphosphoribosylaminopyrimidine deaminase/5-amino-6-(5-phosphoribosylamino)uracil reductase RibD [Protaetiibacter mangrovi]TPW93686.1 bifunctional diaminohydroxyphosphoribosylaminopyrimidine deaminase/5-amino-6-(5-phosphoribosylamino)uracil reductase RibD [Schumannella luteola]
MAETVSFDAAMRRALELAARGPVTGGNPQVGCVLLDDSGAIVAEGWHRGAGTPHAEVDALSHLADAHGLTAVVSLEPCNHTGRTGPCSEALIAAGVARVVYAVSDPGHESAGGAQRLRSAGVEVVPGVLADEVRASLHPWLTAVARRRPWVTVKWASTLDGRAAAADGTSQWITGTAARQRVHEQRAASDAILVGTGTVLADDPSLTARGDGGELLPHQPLPVVVGETAVPADAALRRHPAGLYETGTRDLAAVLAALDARGIRRVYVEGGPTLASAVIAAGFADEYAVYLAPALLGGARLAVGDLGITTIAEARRLAITSIEQLGDDLLVMARPAKGH